jgi:hypothetical protein
MGLGRDSQPVRLAQNSEVWGCGAMKWETERHKTPHLAEQDEQPCARKFYQYSAIVASGPRTDTAAKRNTTRKPLEHARKYF